jgi:antitoxin component of RelBE/YafQ-DinJ toxin-antitoxin module
MANETTAKRTIITIRVTEAELARAHAVADHHGLSIASAVRMLLTRESRTIGVESKAGAR